MTERKLFRQWHELTRSEKGQAVIGWLVIGAVGAFCYKAGQRSVTTDTEQ